MDLSMKCSVSYHSKQQADRFWFPIISSKQKTNGFIWDPLHGWEDYLELTKGGKKHQLARKVRWQNQDCSGWHMEKQKIHIQNNHAQNYISCHFIKDFNKSWAQELCLQNHCCSIHFPCTVTVQTGSALIMPWIVTAQHTTIGNRNDYVQISSALPDNIPSRQNWHYFCWECSPYRADAYLANPPPRTEQGRDQPGEQTEAFWREHRQQSVKHLLTSYPKPQIYINIYIYIYNLFDAQLSPSFLRDLYTVCATNTAAHKRLNLILNTGAAPSNLQVYRSLLISVSQFKAKS